MSDRDVFMGGLLLGILLGGVLAILYAPEKGEKTRRRLARSGGKWVGDAASDAVGSAGELLEKGRRRIGL